MPSTKLKRAHESFEEKEDEVQPSPKRINVSDLPEENKSFSEFDRSTPAKRKLKLKEKSGEKNTSKKLNTTDSVSFKPGQRTALLGTIRSRIRELESRTVYIRHLPRHTTEAQLKKFCPMSVAIKLSTKKRGGFRRGHAFVEFKSEEAARGTVQAASGKLMADRPINLQLCSDRLCKSALSDGHSNNWISPDRRQLTHFSLTTLVVSCVPRVTTVDELQALFPKAEAVEIVRSVKQIPIGLCTVRFSNETDALDAFNVQHGVLVHASPVVVNFAYKRGCSGKIEESQSNPDLVITVVDPKPLAKNSPVAVSSASHPEKERTKKPMNKSKTLGKHKTTNFPPKQLKHLHGKAKSGGKAAL